MWLHTLWRPIERWMLYAGAVLNTNNILANHFPTNRVALLIKQKSEQPSPIFARVSHFSLTGEVETMALMTASDHQDILVEETNFTRIITLNRPRKLNAVTLQMLSGLTQLLTSFNTDPTVKLVVLKGNGKAFCAGGDVASVVQKVREGGHWRFAMKFFRDEFSLDYIIATYSKPIVSILNGIVIGSGVGFSVNGKFRIATEKTMFCKPETSLGSSPNAGASYFLPRLPGFIGEYLALTGARLDGADLLACGLATHYVLSSKLESLEEALSQVNTSDPRVISLIIDEFSHIPPLKSTSPFNDLETINKCFSKGSAREILQALEGEAAKGDGAAWVSTAIQWMKKASPTGLEMTLRSMRHGRHEDIAQSLVRELRIMGHAVRGDVSNDYLEGCRAVLIDKDRKPKWEPSSLEMVNVAMAEHYFTKIDDEKWEDLDLYNRNPSLSVTYAMSKL